MKKKTKRGPKRDRREMPALLVEDMPRAIEFYKNAFGARELLYMGRPGGMAYAELEIGDSVVKLNTDYPGHMWHGETWSCPPEELKGTSASIRLRVENADTVFRRAVSAGAEAALPVEDVARGDRMGRVRDPYGYLWTIAADTGGPAGGDTEETGAKPEC